MDNFLAKLRAIVFPLSLGDWASFASLILAFVAFHGRSSNQQLTWILGGYVVVLAFFVVWREISYARKA